MTTNETEREEFKTDRLRRKLKILLGEKNGDAIADVIIEYVEDRLTEHVNDYMHDMEEI